MHVSLQVSQVMQVPQVMVHCSINYPLYDTLTIVVDKNVFRKAISDANASI